MKVGDLVRLLPDPQVQRSNCDIPADSVGLVVEQGSTPPCPPPGPLASVWIQWSGRPDWDSMYVEDLVVLSEGR